MILNLQGSFDYQVHWIKNLQVQFEAQISKVMLNYRKLSSNTDRGMVLNEIMHMKQ